MLVSDSRKKIYSWALYDWANSTYSTSIMAGFFPLFFKQYWSEGNDPTLTTARLGSLIATSSLLIAVISPLLGAYADLRGHKKILLFLFMLLGVLSSVAMALIPQGQWQMAAIVYGLSMMGFFASIVFYDSLLPSIAKNNETHFASSLGYAMGYLGGGILLFVHVLMFLHPHWFFIENTSQAIQIAFVTVAIWWFVFTWPLLINVPEPKIQYQSKNIFKLFRLSFLKLLNTFEDLLKNKNISIFLLSYWLYIDGIYTVMNMAVDFGLSIGLNSTHLIAALLLVQFVGFPSTLTFSKVAEKWGTKTPILICIGAYFVAVLLGSHMSESWHFFALATFVGVFQGGSQALSRSLFTHLIPESASAEYFGLFNLVGKFASILGPILVGWGSYLWGSHRLGMMSLIVLFILGGLLLTKVKEPNVSA